MTRHGRLSGRSAGPASVSTPVSRQPPWSSFGGSAAVSGAAIRTNAKHVRDMANPPGERGHSIAEANVGKAVVTRLWRLAAVRRAGTMEPPFPLGGRHAGAVDRRGPRRARRHRAGRPGHAGPTRSAGLRVRPRGPRGRAGRPAREDRRLHAAPGPAVRPPGTRPGPGGGRRRDPQAGGLPLPQRVARTGAAGLPRQGPGLRLTAPPRSGRSAIVKNGSRRPPAFLPRDPAGVPSSWRQPAASRLISGALMKASRLFAGLAVLCVLAVGARADE